MSYYVLVVVFCVPTPTYILNTVDVLAGFSVWPASAKSDIVRGRILWANWDVDELDTGKDDILKENLLKVVPQRLVVSFLCWVVVVVVVVARWSNFHENIPYCVEQQQKCSVLCAKEV